MKRDEAVSLLTEMRNDVHFRLHDVNNNPKMRKSERIMNASLYRRQMDALSLAISVLRKELLR